MSEPFLSHSRNAVINAAFSQIGATAFREFVETHEINVVNAVLDAVREHLACACNGIEGHLRERGIPYTPRERARWNERHRHREARNG